MLDKQGICGVIVFSMAKFRIKNASAFKFMIPGNWVIAIHFPTGISAFINFYQYMDIGAYLFKVIPLIGMLPGIRQLFG